MGLDPFFRPFFISFRAQCSPQAKGVSQNLVAIRLDSMTRSAYAFIDSMDPPDIFNAHRGRLFGIAYRMLGSRADVEDILQETYLRWIDAKPSELRSPEGWLVTVVTRLCIDRLRSAKAEREAYTGTWLPEPLVSTEPSSPDRAVELAHDISIAFLTMLERLAPEERAVFLLREVFDFDYAEISRVIGKPSRLPANSPPGKATCSGRSPAILGKPRNSQAIVGKVHCSGQLRYA